MVGVLGYRLLRCKLVLEVNGLVADERRLKSKALQYRSLLNSPCIRLLEASECLGVKSTGRVICVTERILEHLQCQHDIGPSKVVVVHNGVNTALLHPLGDGPPHRELKRAMEMEGRRVICFVGALAPWQGVELSHSQCSACGPGGAWDICDIFCLPSVMAADG